MCVFGDWVVLFFEKMSFKEVMIFGIVGFMVGLFVIVLEDDGLCDDKEVFIIVIGVIGGVVILFIVMLY